MDTTKDAKEILRALLDESREASGLAGAGVRNELVSQFVDALNAPPTVKFRWNKELWPEGNPAGPPSYAKDGDVGADLRSTEDVEIFPGGQKLIKTGLHIELPPGFEAQIRPRSGLALKYKLGLTNSPGTIDTSYTGDLSVMLINHAPTNPLGFMIPVSIKRGDRIAQVVIARAFRANFVEVEELSDTTRGETGFGSSGVK